MSHGARQELIQVLRERYWKVTRFEKTLILNELVALTGHHRKHAIQMMAREPREKASDVHIEDPADLLLWLAGPSA